MQKKLLTVAFILVAFTSTYSQVGIGTQTPNESSQLDIVSNNKGVLIPRVSLTSLTDQTTIIGGNVNSLLVFNTNNAIGSGYYYWMSDKWLKIINAQDLEALPHNNTVNTLLSVDQLDHKLKLQDSDGHIVDVPLSEIFKDQEFVKAITEMHFEEIFNHQNVINKILNTLAGTYGNVSYNAVTNKFQYYNDQGALIDIDWSDFNTTNQSFTVVGADLVITDTAGDIVKVALKTIFDHADFVTAITETHIDKIFNNEEVINKIINNLTGKYGNVVYNKTTNKFQYYNESEVLIDIDLSDFNTTNKDFDIDDTGTQLVITDSDGATVQVDLEDLFQHIDFVTAVTENHVNEIFTNQNVINKIVNTLQGKYGNMVYNTTTMTFEYINNSGDLVPIDWSDFNTTNATFTVVDRDLVITDSDGGIVKVTLKSIFEQADFVMAITEMHVDKIFTNENVINKIIKQLEGKYGNVVYNPTTMKFDYIDENGVLVALDWSDINTTNVSFAVVGSDLVITDSDGANVKVSLESIFDHQALVTAITDVHIKDIFTHPTVKWQILYNLRDHFGNVHYNSSTKTFQYIDSNGDKFDIDWNDINTTNESFAVVGSNLVLKDTDGNTVEVALKALFDQAEFVTAITETHLSKIFNNQEVINNIINNLQGKYGNVVYNATNNVFQYYNDAGVLTNIDWSSINTTNVSLTVDPTGEFLTLKDSDGNNVDVALASLQASRPWNKQNNTTPAVSYLEDIYQQGSVAVGTSIIPSLTIGGVLQDVKFHVDGNITTTGKLYTTSSVYADYVFEKYFTGYSDLRPAYEFKSLEDVKDFIEKNNHLPGVTKIADLSTSENGYTIDMTALSIQQLEKIEELYLHTIEQQGLIDKLGEEIKQLRSESDLVKDRLSQLEDLLSKASI